MTTAVIDQTQLFLLEGGAPWPVAHPPGRSPGPLFSVAVPEASVLLMADPRSEYCCTAQTMNSSFSSVWLL